MLDIKHNQKIAVALLIVICAVAAFGVPAGMAVSYPVELNRTSFPDASFLNYVRQFDSDGDGKLSQAEAEDVEYVDLSNRGIGSLTGIECFKNLSDLDCSGNNLTSLDVRSLTGMRTLRCQSNRLSTLNANLRSLEQLNCMNNQLRALKLDQCVNLHSLNCRNNRLSALPIEQFVQLGQLDCRDNQISSLDYRNSPRLMKYYRADHRYEIGQYICYDYDRPDVNDTWIAMACDAGVTLNDGMEHLTALELPSELNRIDDEAFFADIAFGIVVMDEVDYIGSKAFANCSNLRIVKADEIHNIADDAFVGCHDLAFITMNDDVEDWANAHGFVWVGGGE